MHNRELAAYTFFHQVLDYKLAIFELIGFSQLRSFSSIRHDLDRIPQFYGGSKCGSAEHDVSRCLGEKIELHRTGPDSTGRPLSSADKRSRLCEGIQQRAGAGPAKKIRLR